MWFRCATEIGGGKSGRKPVLAAALGAALVLQAALFAALPAQASSTRTWIGCSATSSNWSDPFNWSTGVAPVAGDSVGGVGGPGGQAVVTITMKIRSANAL